MKIQAVIGANYGDEGKGVITDYLSTAKTLVVRHNGGAQAGHTVTLPSGHAHSFHHIGAGTFKGADTLLGPQFICNPIQFMRERALLKFNLQQSPTVYVDTRALITTPYDMMLNQALERQRGNARHGSCGLGINETVTRTLVGHTIHITDSERKIRSGLHWIREYLSKRAELLNCPLPDEFFSDTLFDNFVNDTLVFFSFIQPCVAEDVLNVRSHIVFEGAQGLALDEINGQFPHVTRSRTGLTNVATLLDGAGLDKSELTVYYTTRAYLTRHGNGPLPNELPGHPFGWVGPEANVENVHQGKFRYAPLDIADLSARILTDKQTIPEASCGLAITCLDQVPMSEAERFDSLPCRILLKSYGPQGCVKQCGNQHETLYSKT